MACILETNEPAPPRLTVFARSSIHASYSICALVFMRLTAFAHIMVAAMCPLLLSLALVGRVSRYHQPGVIEVYELGDPLHVACPKKETISR